MPMRLCLDLGARGSLISMGDSVSEFSKYWLLLQKAHEKEINAVTEEVERWKCQYETERNLVSRLQEQLNEEVEPRVERLQKLLNIAETKIAEKEAKIVEKDERISCLEVLIETKTAEEVAKISAKDQRISHLESLIEARTAEEVAKLCEKDKTISHLESLIEAKTAEAKNIERTLHLESLIVSKTAEKARKDENQHDDSNLTGNKLNSNHPCNSTMPDDLETHNNTFPPVDERSINTSPASPSLLENTNSLSTPSRTHSNIVKHKWMKRKKRKRLKQTTLTQHDRTDHKRQKLSDSVKVVPQTPAAAYIDLSSGEDEQPLGSQDAVSYDSSGEYDSCSDNVMSQNCDTTNQDYTFVPDSSQRHATTNQDDTFVDNARNQVYDLTSDQTEHISLVNNSKAGVSRYLGSTNSTNQAQSPVKVQSCKLKRSSSEPKYVEVCRKKSDRKKLNAVPCQECAEWYAGDDPEAIKQTCRHRSKYPPPDTPPDFWKIGFPDTAES